MEFVYRGRNKSGQLAEGSIEADSRDAAASAILKTGVTPVHLELKEAFSDPLADLREWMAARATVDLDELIIFCRQMHALSKAGIPIVSAFRGLSSSSQSAALKRALDEIAAKLQSGVNLASCLQEFPHIFPELFIAIVHVGENTGQIDDSFRRLAQNLELERQARKRVKQAMRYPTMVVGALSAAMVVINVWVIPAFSSVFERLGADLPLPTQILVATSGMFLNYWWLMLLVIAGAGFSFHSWKTTKEGEYQWDHWKLRIPLLGRLLELVALSRFSRNFSMMLYAGLPITQSLSLVAGAVGNAWIGRAVADMRTGIEHGETMVAVAAKSGIFSPLVMQMLAVGEETGQVEHLLSDVADFYDEEVEYGLSHLSEAIEPILILLMGGMVLVLALGVFLPIWSLGEAAVR